MSYRPQNALFLTRFIFLTMDLLSYIIDSHLQQCINFSLFHLINFLQTVFKWYTFTIPLAQRRRAAVSHYIIGYVKKSGLKKCFLSLIQLKDDLAESPVRFMSKLGTGEGRRGGISNRRKRYNLQPSIAVSITPDRYYVS